VHPDLTRISHQGTSDPYAELELSGCFGWGRKKSEWIQELRFKAQTHVVAKTLNPVWNTKELTWPLRRHSSILKIRVFDHDELGTPDPLGHAVLHIDETLPGEYDRWFALHDPSESMDLVPNPADLHESESGGIKGPGIHLRVKIELSDFGELCSYMWAPPKCEKGLLPRFDPNVFFEALNGIQEKMLARVATLAAGVSDAVFWARGPSYTFTFLSCALLLCRHIDQFWLLLHSLLALSLIMTGLLSGGGNVPLSLPEIFSLDESAPAKQKEDSNSRPADKPTASTKTAEGAHPTKLFTGTTEYLLRQAGNSLGGAAVAEAQAAVREMMAGADTLDCMLNWSRKDLKLGFGSWDGPVLATGFIMGNLFMALLHSTVPLRHIAMLAVLGLFGMSLVKPFSSLLPQALKVRKARTLMRLLSAEGNKPGLPDRPKAQPTRKLANDNKGLEKFVRAIFRKVDKDNSGTVSLHEIFEVFCSPSPFLCFWQARPFGKDLT